MSVNHAFWIRASDSRNLIQIIYRWNSSFSWICIQSLKLAYWKWLGQAKYHPFSSQMGKWISMDVLNASNKQRIKWPFASHIRGKFPAMFWNWKHKYCSNNININQRGCRLHGIKQQISQGLRGQSICKTEEFHEVFNEFDGKWNNSAKRSQANVNSPGRERKREPSDGKLVKCYC